jgi:flagellar hook assembly protein FlgD
MSNQDMAAQLAQFTQLELTEESNTNISEMTESMNSLNSSFEGAMLMAEFNYASNFLGKEVYFNDAYHDQSVTGKVTKVSFDGQEPVLEVEGKVKLNDGSDSDLKTFTIKPHEVLGLIESNV